jgi:signal transduction histidine kinase
VLDRGYIIHDAAGKPVRLVGGLSDISERRMAEKALESSRRQLRALTARLQSGREQERTAIAREIHDDLGQLLTALKMNLDWLEREIGERNGKVALDSLLERILESGEIIESATQSVQRISSELRPASLDHLGLLPALTEEARRFEQRGGVSCELQLPTEPLGLPPAITTAIFRVFQEALTNVARHAQATAVHVALETNEENVILRLEDNGKGIPPEAMADPRSLGLLGMTERASALGGYAAIEPISPHGTRVTLQLPRNPVVAETASDL